MIPGIKDTNKQVQKINQVSTDRPILGLEQAKKLIILNKELSTDKTKEKDNNREISSTLKKYRISKDSLEIIIDSLLDNTENEEEFPILEKILENNYLTKECIEMVISKAKEKQWSMENIIDHLEENKFGENLVYIDGVSAILEKISTYQAIPFDILIEHKSFIKPYCTRIDDNIKTVDYEKLIDYYTSDDSKKFILTKLTEINYDSGENFDIRMSYTHGYYGVSDLIRMLIDEYSNSIGNKNVLLSDKRYEYYNDTETKERIENKIKTFLIDTFTEFSQKSKELREKQEYNRTNSTKNLINMFSAVSKDSNTEEKNDTFELQNSICLLLEKEINSNLLILIKEGCQGPLITSDSIIDPKAFYGKVSEKISFNISDEVVNEIIKSTDTFGIGGGGIELLNMYAGVLKYRNERNDQLDTLLLNNFTAFNKTSYEKLNNYLISNVLIPDNLHKIPLSELFEFSKNVAADTFNSRAELINNIKNYVSKSIDGKNLTLGEYINIKVFIKELDESIKVSNPPLNGENQGDNMDTIYTKSQIELSKVLKRILDECPKYDGFQKSLLGTSLLFSKGIVKDYIIGADIASMYRLNELKFEIPESFDYMEKELLSKISIDSIASIILYINSNTTINFYRTDLKKYLFDICFGEIFKRIKEGDHSTLTAIGMTYSAPSSYRSDLCEKLSQIILDPSNNEIVNGFVNSIKEYSDLGKNVLNSIKAIFGIQGNLKILLDATAGNTIGLEAVNSIIYSNMSKPDFINILKKGSASNYKLKGTIEGMVKTDIVYSNIFGGDPIFTKEFLKDNVTSHYLAKNEIKSINKGVSEFIVDAVSSISYSKIGRYESLIKALGRNENSMKVAKIKIRDFLLSSTIATPKGEFTKHGFLVEVEKGIGTDQYFNYSQDHKNLIQILDRIIEKSGLEVGDFRNTIDIVSGTNNLLYFTPSSEKFIEEVKNSGPDFFNSIFGIEQDLAFKIDCKLGETSDNFINKYLLMKAVDDSELLRKYFVRSFLNIEIFSDKDEIRSLRASPEESVRNIYKEIYEIAKTSILNHYIKPGMDKIKMISFVETECNKNIERIISSLNTHDKNN